MGDKSDVKLTPKTLAPQPPTGEGVYNAVQLSFEGFTPTAAVFPEPVVCIPGAERPNFVPEYIGKEKCGLKEAKQGMRLALDSYRSSCQDKKYSDPVSFKLPAAFRFSPQSCSHGRERWGQFDKDVVDDIPFILENFGLLEPPHSFFDIAYRLNADQIHDFRSAAFFSSLADQLKDGLKGHRSLSVTYPASGSHMAPVVTALKLIDDKVIDRAAFVYTEIDSRAVDRVRAYLEASAGLFQNLTIEFKAFYHDGSIRSGKLGSMSIESMFLKIAKSSEVTFSWTYQGKPVSLMLAIGRSEGLVRDEYLMKKDSHLVVIHDGAEHKMNEQLLVSLSKAKHAAPLWLLAEPKELPLRDSKLKVQNVLDGKVAFKFNGRSYETTFLEGRYGCGSGSKSNQYQDAIFSYKVERGKPAKLVRGPREGQDPFLRHNRPLNLEDFSSSYLDVHIDQKNKPVLLITIP